MNTNNKLIRSFNYAINGLIYSFKTQLNMRIHFIIAIAVLILAVLVHVSKIELLIIFFAIALVLVAEMINTSIETTVDLVTKEYKPLAKASKDISAGAVLIAAINAIITGYLIFYDKLSVLTKISTKYVKHLPVHITFASLVIVLLIVIISKALNHKGTFIQGGLPSGHSAIAFCLFTSVTLLSNNALISTLCGLLAFLVAQSRVEAGIHSIFEVIVGGVIGVLVTLLIFKIVFPI